MGLAKRILENPFFRVGDLEIREILKKASFRLKMEPSVVETSSRSVLFIGDTHGDVLSSIKAREVSKSMKVNLVTFLGDYVDRGPYQIENLLFVLSWKIEEPDKVVLLRGNHESYEMNSYYGFISVLRSRGLDFNPFSELYESLPVAAVVNGSLLAVHGGIPKNSDLNDLSKEDALKYGSPTFQVMWNDPSELVEEFGPSTRGFGAYTFGEKALRNFLKQNGLKKLVRSHQFVPEGYKEMFGGILINIFSCRFYGGRPAAALLENDELMPVSLL